jgi:hypothetical protein
MGPDEHAINGSSTAPESSFRDFQESISYLSSLFVISWICNIENLQ